MKEPNDVRYKMSNLHLLDWGWTPEKGSQAHERRKTRQRPKGHRWAVKMHIRGLGCYWATRKRARLVDAEEFSRGKDWEQCWHCIGLLQDLQPKTKPPTKSVPLEVLKPGGYVEPLEYTKEERSALATIAKTTDHRCSGFRTLPHRPGGKGGNFSGMR